MPHYGPHAIFTHGGKIKVIIDDPNAPEMCCKCGEIFKKGDMYRTPDGLMCEDCWRKSKYYQAPQPGQD
jgi:formylmethanofuran dehydrogenase subunit E